MTGSLPLITSNNQTLILQSPYTYSNLLIHYWDISKSIAAPPATTGINGRKYELDITKNFRFCIGNSFTSSVSAIFWGIGISLAGYSNTSLAWWGNTTVQSPTSFLAALSISQNQYSVWGLIPSNYPLLNFQDSNNSILATGTVPIYLTPFNTSTYGFGNPHLITVSNTYNPSNGTNNFQINLIIYQNPIVYANIFNVSNANMSSLLGVNFNSTPFCIYTGWNTTAYTRNGFYSGEYVQEYNTYDWGFQNIYP